MQIRSQNLQLCLVILIATIINTIDVSFYDDNNYYGLFGMSITQGG